MSFIIAVDPGITSGIALIEIVPGGIKCLSLRQVKVGPGGLVETAVSMWAEQAPSLSAVVIEDFILPHRVHGPKEAKATLLLIGALDSWAKRTGLQVFYITPPETKAFPMKRVCEVTGKSPQEMRKMPHASDAVRVALAYWCKCHRA